MKKIIALLTLCFSLTLAAQDTFTEGKIISKQSMSSDNAEMQAQFNAMGSMVTTTYFKGDKSRSEVNSPMTGNITTITDNVSKEVMVLMDNPMLGKTYSKQKSEITDEQLEAINIVPGDKTKTVLGYDCKQYTVNVNQEGMNMEMELYTTEAIPVTSQQSAMLGGKLKGFPLYITIKMNQMDSTMTITTEVTEIQSESVADDKFSMTPPEGYKEMSGQ